VSEADGPRAHPREVRAALRRAPLVDAFLCCRYSFSPYMACGHGCAYCDGRAERYWVQGVFDRDIVVRENVAGLLARELPRLRERAPVALGSGITDAYQPLEKTRGLTRECARVLSDHGLPVSVLTKSALVLRDLDTWDAVNRRGGFILNLSITTLDESVRRRFEPGASSIAERLEAMKAFGARGIPVGVMAMPLLPFISDGDAEVRALLAVLKEAGAIFVITGGLTLRPGRQKDFFLQRLGETCPDLVPRYREIYAEERPSGSSTRSYRALVEARFAAAARELDLPFLLPHAWYRGRLPLYDEVHLLLQHLVEIYRARGVQTRPLEDSARRFAGWLLGRKREFNRRRSQTQEALEAQVRELFQGPGACGLLGNEKLASFLRAVAVDRRILDYRSLSLVEAGGPEPGGRFLARS